MRARRDRGVPAHPGRADRPGSGAAGQPPAHRVRPPVAQRGPGPDQPAVQFRRTASSPTPSAPNIYAWLPFSQSDLAKAAGVTEAFGAAYDTFSYRESAAAYVAPMRNLATTELTGSLARGYSTLGVASQRTKQQQVSTATAVINSLRSFGASSLIFVVTINQRLHTTQGSSPGSSQWAITVVNNGGTWLVNDIEPAQAGNT